MLNLKFRLVLGDKILPVKLIEFKDGKLLRVAPDDRERVEWYYPGHPSFFVEQWTGLVDKNNAMIWEGDIVDYWRGGLREFVDRNKRKVVSWITPMRSNVGFNITCPTNERLEVIGNVHENPELFENEAA